MMVPKFADREDVVACCWVEPAAVQAQRSLRGTKPLSSSRKGASLGRVALVVTLLLWVVMASRTRSEATKGGYSGEAENPSNA